MQIAVEFTQKYFTLMVRDFGYTPDYFAASQHGRCSLSELPKRPVAGEVHLVRAGAASSLVRSPGAATRCGNLAVDQARFLVLVSVIDLRAGIPVGIATPDRVP